LGRIKTKLLQEVIVFNLYEVVTNLDSRFVAVESSSKPLVTVAAAVAAVIATVVTAVAAVGALAAAVGAVMVVGAVTVVFEGQSYF
jgi:phage-related minor tail protein